MVNLYLLTYNSYYTRQIKKLSTITDYSKYVIASYTNINFIFNDGVDTSQILNYNPGTVDANYCLVEDLDNDKKLSRWFIVNSIRTRKGQYQLSLHRDLIADNLKLSVYSTSYILKGYTQYGNSAFYADEEIVPSQVLKKREFLTDNTGCSWLVAYVKPHNYSYTGESGGTDDPNKWETSTVVAQSDSTVVDYTFSTYDDLVREINKFSGEYLSPTSICIGSQYWSHVWTTGGYYYFDGYYSDNQFITTDTSFSKMGNSIFSYYNDNGITSPDIFSKCSETLKTAILVSGFKVARDSYPTALYTTCIYKDRNTFKARR